MTLAGVDSGLGPSTAHLLQRLADLEGRVRAAVARRRRGDPAPDDPFRGLYLSDDHVDRLLAGDRDDPDWVAAPSPGPDAGAGSDPAGEAGAGLRLLELRRRFALDPGELELFMVALAPDLDPRFEQLYGYLNDDVTRRRATVGLALQLCGVAPTSARARTALGAGARLVRTGLVLVEDAERPWLTRALRVPDRVAAWCLGDDRPDPEVAVVLDQCEEMVVGDPAPLARCLEAGAKLVYLRAAPGSGPRSLAAAALRRAGRGVLMCDLGWLDPSGDPVTLGRALGLEATLSGAGLVAGPLEALVEGGPAPVRSLAGLEATVVLWGRPTWDPSWSRRVPLVVDAPRPSPAQREELWRASLGARLAGGEVDPAEVTAQFRLGPEQIQRASMAAAQQAELDGLKVAASHVMGGARAQNAAGLDRLSRRIEPAVGWDDLVLSPGVEAHLWELAARARHRGRVLGDWGMRPGGGRGQGIAALFAGESGTGKTMSAEVLAGELGLDLYAVNLATVVDKYVGETEKNLERIFSEADGVNAVLLFDEADALFGKRSEVRDANDRYANIEVAYLLQRMESFDGLAVLSTNLAANIDEAFARRLDALVEFPMPDVDQRRHLWERGLSPGVPRHPDLDLEFCARAFELSGGSIRAITLSAAYLAADSGGPVAMSDLVRCIQREYRKLGRLCVASEFGPFFSLLS